MKYKYLEHTADVKFEAYGTTLEECFESVCEAVFGVITDVKKIDGSIAVPIKISAKDLEKLLYDFIDELIFLIDTKNILVKKCGKMKIEKKGTRTILTCILECDHIEKYETWGAIKAPTYNQMNITKRNGKWVSTIVLDI